jgi:hypothetical protein
MTEKIWPAAVTAIAAVFSLMLAIWPGGMIRGGVDRFAANPFWLFTAHLMAGALGVFALLYVHRGRGVARVALGLAAIILATLLLSEPIHLSTLVTVVLPALGLTAGAILLAPPASPVSP